MAPDTQEERERLTRVELAVLVRPFAAHLSKVLASSEGQPQVSRAHRALLRAVPPDALASAVVRTIIGLLWRRKRDEDTGKWESHLAVEMVQVVGRAVGLRALQAFMRVKYPDLSQRLADLKLEEMQGKITLKHQTTIGFYLTNELHISVPGLLHLHRSQRGSNNYNSPLCLSLKSDGAAFGLPTLLTASDRRPMIEPPLPWRSPLDAQGNAVESRGGYRYALRGSVPLLTSVSPSESDPECPQVVYDALNALQATPWRVNCEVLDVVLKVKADEETQSYASMTPEEQHKRDQEDAIITEATCEVFQPVLYFVHWLDYRGRVYVNGTHLFPGGPDLSRALLTFAQGRVITSQDREAIAALDRYGKECLGGTLQPENVARIGQNPVGTRALWWKADDRWQYLAYCLERTALTGALASGKSYETTLAVWQDASANGLQHMALLLRDPTLASKVNVAPSNGVDIYAEVAKKMTLHLRRMKTKDSKALLKHCGGEITRDHAKNPTMTFGYGGVWQTFYESFAVKEFGLEHAPNGKGLLWKSGAVGNKQRRLASCFASAAWTTLKDDAAPKAVELRAWFRTVAEAIGRTKKPATWIVPGTHFLAVQRRSSKAKTGRFRLWWSENGTKEEYWVTAPIKQSTTLDPKSHRKSFAPNVIHSLDAAHLMLTVTRAHDENFDTPLGTIHDSFATCASDAPGLEQLFKLGFARIYGPTYIDSEGIARENNPFLSLVDQLRQQCGNDKFPKPPEQGNLDVAQVYAASPLH